MHLKTSINATIMGKNAFSNKFLHRSLYCTKRKYKTITNTNYTRFEDCNCSIPETHSTSQNQAARGRERWGILRMSRRPWTQRSPHQTSPQSSSFVCTNWNGEVRRNETKHWQLDLITKFQALKPCGSRWAILINRYKNVCAQPNSLNWNKLISAMLCWYRQK